MLGYLATILLMKKVIKATEMILIDIIQKQTNHLIYELKRSESIEDKLIVCASVILVGLCYQDQKNYLSFGCNLLKKFLN